MITNVTVGIDGGLNGGLAAYSAGENYLQITPMPIVKVKVAKGNKNQYDIPAIIHWFKEFHGLVKMAVLEKAHAFPGMGAQSTFMNGQNFGIMQGILTCLRMPYMVIHSKSWQKKMFEGIAHTDTKQASILVAQRLFPMISFKATERSTKAHDGLTDAALMAVYASKL